MAETLAQTLSDLRFALRSLMRRPAYAVAGVLTLALGIGAATAVLSVVDTILLQPLAFGEPEGLVRVYSAMPERDIDRSGLFPADLASFRDDPLESFTEATGYTYFGLSLDRDGRPREITTLRVTPGLLAMLRVPPLHGRTFLPEEAQEGAGRVVVVSHSLWRQELGADPEIVGRTVQLENEPWTVVGVMPAGFAFPGPGVDLWIPADLGDPNDRGYRFASGIARLAPGVSLEAAQAELDARARALAEAYPDSHRGWELRAVSLTDQVVGPIRPALLILLAAALLLLVIACVNVANLTLTRATVRHRELAVRHALGASRGRLGRLLVAESLVLAFLGGLLGLALAAAGVALLAASAPPDLPRAAEIGLDPRMVLFAAGAALATVPLVALLPALRLSRSGLGGALTEGGRGGSAGPAGHRARNGLTAVQVALAVVLLLGAGLMIRSFLELAGQDPGFEPDGALAVQLFVYGPRYSEEGQTQAFVDRLVEGLEALPGAEAVGVTNSVPLSEISGGQSEVLVAGRPEEENRPAGVRITTPGYLAALGTDLVAGRPFSDRDRADGEPVALINQIAARTFFPGEDPLGERLTLNEGETWRTVVGVVADVRHSDLEEAAEPEVWVPFEQATGGTMTAVVRTAGDPAVLLEPAQEVVWGIDPQQPIYKAFTLERLVADATAQRRVTTVLIVAFALLAVILAVVGLYGVIAYGVAQRTREIAVRLALGARRREVIREILTGAALVIALGLGVGIALALVSGRFAESLLYGIATTDLWTFLAAPALLLVAALVASYLPARRASRLDPAIALREE